MSPASLTPPSLFPTYALDQAFCGLTAGIVSSLCMHPLDLIKVQQQVSIVPSISSLSSLSLSRSLKPPAGAGAGRVIGATTAETTAGGIKGLYQSLYSIAKTSGIKGLYRGLTPNLVGNASSWGLYFLW